MAPASKPYLSPDLLDQYGLTFGTLVDETRLAQIWRVVRQDQSIACLKTYHGATMRNERPGFDLLASVKGQGATYIYEIDDNSALMEWLEGESLGDMARAGNDHEAAHQLVKTACGLHRHFPKSFSDIKGLQRLDESWFYGMFDKSFAPDLTIDAQKLVQRCEVTYRELMATDADMCAMHGDLHHDNVKNSSRGYLALDSKGAYGDRCYELANAFRNPKGMGRKIYDLSRIQMLAGIFSNGFDADYDRLLKWAAVKCCWSISLRSGEQFKPSEQFELIALYFAALDKNTAA